MHICQDEAIQVFWDIVIQICIDKVIQEQSKVIQGYNEVRI